MKRRKLAELYGRRYTPWINFIGVLLVVAFGIFLAITDGKKEADGGEAQTEQLKSTDRGFGC